QEPRRLQDFAHDRRFQLDDHPAVAPFDHLPEAYEKRQLGASQIIELRQVNDERAVVGLLEFTKNLLSAALQLVPVKGVKLGSQPQSRVSGLAVEFKSFGTVHGPRTP